MDGGKRRIGWAGALVALSLCTTLHAAAPADNPLFDELAGKAVQAEVAADQGGVTIEPVKAGEPADEPATAEPDAPAKKPAPNQPNTAERGTTEPIPGEASGAGGEQVGTLDTDSATRGVGDEGKRGAGVDLEGKESATPIAPAAATPAREQLPLGVVRNGESKGFGDAAASSPVGGVGGIGILRTLGAVGVVVLLIVLTRVLLSRVARLGNSGLRAQLGPGGRAPSGIVQILGRYPVARGQTLVLLKLDRRVLLLSQTAAGFNTLSEITDAEDVASILSKSRDEEGESISARFGTLLRRLERDPGIADGDDVEIAPYLRRPSLDEVDGLDESYATEPDAAPQEPEDPGDALRRRLEGLRGLSA